MLYFSLTQKKKKPQWLRFFHSKCENLAPSQLSWAENGKNLAELESMRNFREEYDRLFERKLKGKKTKTNIFWSAKNKTKTNLKLIILMTLDNK